MNDPISNNIIGVQSLVGSKLNKVNAGATVQLEGIEGEERDILTLDLSDDELIALSKKWEANYAGYEAALKIRQEANKSYYLGRQREGSAMATTDGMPISANLLFEAEETFLPAALAKNPEPVVWSDDSEQGTNLANDVKRMLQYHADTLVLRRKLTKMTRHWTLYFIGIIKHGWDNEIQEITSEVRNPKNFIFDPNGFVDEYGDYNGYLGERITITAEKLAEMFPEAQSYITVLVDGKMGTDVVYTEWWNDDYTFVTFKGKILDKSKNPHFNYEQKNKTLDQDGMVAEEKIPGKNHFARPKMPYTFLCVFNLGEHPHDDTGLIEQNIPNQRRVSRRTEQIDYNLSRQNNSTAFSEDNFTQETAKQAATAMAKGHPVLVPSGKPINEAISKIEMSPVPAGFFTALENDKHDLRSIFGTQGITAQDDNKKETARGMILENQHDTTRIGGGVGDAIEQVADNIFNWWVQMYHVYYDVPHVATVMGQMKAVEYVTLSAQSLNAKVVVSVSPDSMKPKDEVTEMNQAMSLFEAGALDPKTLLTRVNFPDPQKTAEQATLWHIDPQAYMQINFPEIAAQLQQIQAQAMQMQQAQQQVEMEQQGQQAQQGMAIQGAQAQQKMSQTEMAHQQKITHAEQANAQKLAHAGDAAKQKLSVQKAGASLSKVKLPK